MKNIVIQLTLLLIICGFSCVKSSDNPTQIIFQGKSWDLYKMELFQGHQYCCNSVSFDIHIDGQSRCFREKALNGEGHLYALLDECLPDALQQIVQHWTNNTEVSVRLKNCHSPNNTVTVNIDSSDENKQKIQAYVNANSVNANGNQSTKYQARRPWGGLALLAAVIVAIYFYVKRC